MLLAAGCFIVYDYVGQLNDELEVLNDVDNERGRINPYGVQPTMSNVSSTNTMPAMRTTYDTATYGFDDAAPGQPEPIMKSAYEGQDVRGENPFADQGTTKYSRDY